MFELWEMETKRLKVRRYLRFMKNDRVNNDRWMLVQRTKSTFNKKDHKELERLRNKCENMNKLFSVE